MNATGDMKADFKKFRLYSRMATVFMIMAVAAFVAVMIIAIVCGDDIVKVSIAIAAMIVIGIPAVIFEYKDVPPRTVVAWVPAKTIK